MNWWGCSVPRPRAGGWGGGGEGWDGSFPTGRDLLQRRPGPMDTGTPSFPGRPASASTCLLLCFSRPGVSEKDARLLSLPPSGVMRSKTISTSCVPGSGSRGASAAVTWGGTLSSRGKTEPRSQALGPDCPGSSSSSAILWLCGVHLRKLLNLSVLQFPHI